MRRASRAALDAGASPVFVVVGAKADSVADALTGMRGVEALTNSEWEKGLSSSLSVGLRAVLDNPEIEAALVTLADQPFVDAAALTSLIAAFDDDHRIIASSYDGTLGVPALFGREFLAELTELTGDAGAGSWLRARPSGVTALPLEKAALDVDLPSDAALLR